MNVANKAAASLDVERCNGATRGGGDAFAFLLGLVSSSVDSSESPDPLERLALLEEAFLFTPANAALWE